MANPQPQDVLGRITLVTGPEEFLGERAISAVRSAVRRHDEEAEFSETMAASLTMATLGDMAAPSLFSTTRCVVVRRLEDLPEESAPGLLDYAADPAEDVALVLAHSGGQKGSGLADQAAQGGRRHRGEVRAPDDAGVPGLRGQRAARTQGAHRARRRGLPDPGGRPGPAGALCRCQPAGERLRGPAAHGRDGEEVLRGQGRGEVVRRGRPHASTARRPARWKSCAGRWIAALRPSWSPAPWRRGCAASPGSCPRRAGCATTT